MATEFELKRFFESWPEPIFLLDKWGKVLVTNTPAKIFHPKLKTQTHCMHIRDIVEFIDDQYPSLIRNCLGTNSPVTVSLRLKKYKSNGSNKVKFQGWRYSYKADVFIVLRAANFMTAIKKFETLNNSIERLNSEIRKRQRTEMKLRKSLNESRNAHEAKDKFLHQVSHEFRTPLNAILGMSEIMRDQVFGELNDHYRSYAQDIHGCGRNLLELIEEILKFKESNAKDVTVTDLSDCVHFAMDAVSTLAQTKRLSLEIHDESKLPAIRADNALIRRILINLMSNAVKYTPSGGKVDITPEPEVEGEFCLSVSDTGIGIRKRDLEHIFEPFFRAEDVYVKKEDGLGMGLALTKKAVEILGGHIDIHSHFGHGTKVRVCFPNNVIFGNA